MMNKESFSRRIPVSDIHDIQISDFPDWPCPNCDNGRLVVENGSQNLIRRGGVCSDSVSEDHIEFLFTAEFRCSTSQCSGMTLCCGSGGVDYCTDNETGEQFWDSYLCVKYFEPPLNLFPIRNGVPSAVADALRESFALYFASPIAALTQLRVTIEILLDSLDVDAFEDADASGIKRPILLVKRIAKFGEQNPGLRPAFTALRKVGNAGAHGHALVHESDVLNGYEILENVLNHIYWDDENLIAKVDKKFGWRK